MIYDSMCQLSADDSYETSRQIWLPCCWKNNMEKKPQNTWSRINTNLKDDIYKIKHRAVIISDEI